MAHPGVGAAGSDFGDRFDIDIRRAAVLLDQGDPSPLAEAYAGFYSAVHRYMRVTLRDEHEADDATQEVLIRAFEALRGFEERGVPFRVWLFKVARNHAFDLRRREARVQHEPPKDLERRLEALPGPPPPAHRDFDIMKVTRRLSRAQRQVIFLRYVVGLDLSQTAAVMGKDPGVVGSLHHRALTALRPRLAQLLASTSADAG